MRKAITAKYYDIHGKLLWTEPYIFERRYAEGDEFVREYKGYLVIESILLGNKYIVKVENVE